MSLASCNNGMCFYRDSCILTKAGEASMEKKSLRIEEAKKEVENQRIYIDLRVRQKFDLESVYRRD